MPPAVQIEIRQRPPPRCFSSLAAVATMRAPVAANGWPAASDEPLGLIFAGIDAAQRRVQAEAGLAVVLALPRAQRAQHLRGEGFVDLVEVEVLQRQAVALEHLRHRDGRRHQQAFAVDEIDRGDLRVAQVAQHFVAVLRAPIRRWPAGRRRRRRSAGWSCRRSACRCPEVLSNAGFSVASFSSVRVRAQDVVARRRRGSCTTRSSKKPRS